MVRLLYKYLIIHKQVAVPGVGIFYIERKPARHDVANKVFQSPILNIDFRAETAITDKEFFQFVSKEKGIDEVEAVKHLHEFAHRLQQHVSAHKRVELPGMGVLIKNGLGEVSFEPLNVLTTYFPPTIEERLFINKPEETINAKNLTTAEKQALYDKAFPSSTHKDRWWIFALVVAIIAIAAIGYYYYQNGSIM